MDVMSFEQRLQAILAEDTQPLVPALQEIEELPEPVAKTLVTISALGGRSRVEVDEGKLKKLIDAAGLTVAGDLEAAALGTLIQQAKHDRSPLLDALLRVRAGTRLYRVTSSGRSWWSVPRPAPLEVAIS